MLTVTGCNFKIRNCDLGPTVTPNELPSKNTKTNKDIIDEVTSRVSPGASLNCTM